MSLINRTRLTFFFSHQVKAEFDGLLKAVDGQLGDEEMQNVKELKMYMMEDEGAWALGENFINFLGA